MTDKDGSKWIYDVHVYPKNATNEIPVIHKSVTKEGNQHENKSVSCVIAVLMALLLLFIILTVTIV